MRADRLLSLLMLLQTRGKLTADRLAEELEVSVRTIYRDVYALRTRFELPDFPFTANVAWVADVICTKTIACG